MRSAVEFFAPTNNRNEEAWFVKMGAIEFALAMPNNYGCRLQEY